MKYLCESMFQFPFKMIGSGIYDKSGHLVMSFSPLGKIYAERGSTHKIKIFVSEILSVLNGERTSINLKKVKFDVRNSIVYINDLVIGHTIAPNLMLAIVTKGVSDDHKKMWKDTYEIQSKSLIHSLSFMIKDKLNKALDNSKYQQTKPLVFGIVASLQQNFNIVESLIQHHEQRISQDGRQGSQEDAI